MKPSQLLLLSFLFSATPALAHLESGTWTGTTPDGSPCSMSVGDQYFENNNRHPLNERIPVTMGKHLFVVGHPPVLDFAARPTVQYDHDHFEGVVATSTGGAALRIAMEHSEAFEGPRSFMLIEHAWKADQRTATVCGSLRLEKKPATTEE